MLWEYAHAVFNLFCRMHTESILNKSVKMHAVFPACPFEVPVVSTRAKAYLSALFLI